MRALTLTQPWASLVAIGAKRCETRGWSTSYRGPLAIHAAKGWTWSEKEDCHTEPFASALWEGGIRTLRMMPLGAIVAVAYLDRCIASEDFEAFAKDHPERIAEHERDFGNYGPRRFFFALTGIWRVPAPVPCRGALGLWEVPGVAWHEVQAQQLAESLLP